ncbi:MAG TPA: hybrid sensor histidine kinase/response regulator [Polyangiaceae bacterium]|nr:hybrid sensor histidine kinase/response regulator [Polyangiaceae bacterium]
MPKVLHIEDDPANRLLVRKLLTPAGFEVVDAVDGLDGVKKATEGTYDLVLVDIAIPGLDGYEVTLRLRSEPSLKSVPIVAITAEGSRNTSLSVGCDGFLQKPIDARSFVRTLEGYLKGQKEGLPPEQTGEHLRKQSQRIAHHLEQKVAELSLANQRLVELDQARKEFYRNISHELSTPMTPIVGYTKLLLDLELGELNPSQSKALRSMLDCVERLRGLIDNLLDVTGIETGRLRFANQPYDLVQAVKTALETTEAARRKKQQTVRTEISLAHAEARGDGRRVGRAVEQLLENASKFSPVGTTLGLRLRALPEHQFEVEVVDQGPGVAPELAGRVFEPFFQIDGSPTRAQGGTGVGLAVVRGVARGHGGDAHLNARASAPIDGVAFSGASFSFVVAVTPSGLA